MFGKQNDMTQELVTQEPVYVDNANALLDAVNRCRLSGMVAIDSEFIHRRTYYAQPALYQVQVDNQCYLVDALAIDHWDPFIDMLEDANVVKIMHGCQADLSLFAAHLKAYPTNLFDTQLAAAFTGSRYTIGYQPLVLEMLSVHVSKEATLSNWLQRPLSEDQVQ